MKKLSYIGGVILLVVALISLSGCEKVVNEPMESDESVLDGVQTDDGESSEDTDEVDVDESSEDEILIPDEHTTTVQAKVVGLIDGNSFEAMVDDQPVVFRATELVALFDELGVQDGDMVTIEYTTNETGQNIVIHIEK